MDKDLLQQYKYMDTPNVLDHSKPRDEQASTRKMANWFFNFLNPQ